MPLLPYDYLHLVNCPEVVTISDILFIVILVGEKEREVPDRLTLWLQDAFISGVKSSWTSLYIYHVNGLPR